MLMLAWDLESRPVVQVSLVEVCLTYGFKDDKDNAVPLDLLKFITGFSFLDREARRNINSTPIGNRCF